MQEKDNAGGNKGSSREIYNNTKREQGEGVEEEEVRVRNSAYINTKELDCYRTMLMGSVGREAPRRGSCSLQYARTERALLLLSLLLLLYCARRMCITHALQRGEKSAPRSPRFWRRAAAETSTLLADLLTLPLDQSWKPLFFTPIIFEFILMLSGNHFSCLKKMLAWFAREKFNVRRKYLSFYIIKELKIEKINRLWKMFLFFSFICVYVVNFSTNSWIRYMSGSVGKASVLWPKRHWFESHPKSFRLGYWFLIQIWWTVY